MCMTSGTGNTLSIEIIYNLDISRDMRVSTMWFVRPTKPLIGAFASHLNIL